MVEVKRPKSWLKSVSAFANGEGGVLKMDATCADAEMRYPVDVDIIHDGCRKVTDYIMKVCEKSGLHKPRTNYKHARRAYLLLVKKAKKKGKMVRETIAVMLNYLHKDIRILMDLLAKNKTFYESLFLYEKRTLTAIFKMYHQQEEMFRIKTHTQQIVQLRERGFYRMKMFTWKKTAHETENVHHKILDK